MRALLLGDRFVRTDLHEEKEGIVRVDYSPVSERVFPLKLANLVPSCFGEYLRWLSHLLQRLGKDCTLALWHDAYRDYDDELLLGILRTGWDEVSKDDLVDVEEATARLFLTRFPVSVEGVSIEEAKELVKNTPPIGHIEQFFPSLNVWRLTTAYEGLHLRFDGLALLAEAMMRSLGKQGELIAYDLVRETRLEAAAGRTGSVAEFISDFTSVPDEASLFTAGLDTETIRTSEKEAVVHVRECEWARYFRERHPQCGYLMACSTDEAAFRAFNENLRMQRGSTLMEGGKVCDFRIFETERAPDSS